MLRLQLESRDDMPVTDIQQNLSAEDVVAVCFVNLSMSVGFLGRRLKSCLSSIP